MGKNKGGIPDAIKEIIVNLREDDFDADTELETRGKIKDIVRAYRTTSTQVLNVLSRIHPLHLTAKAEFQNFQTWACRSVELGRLLYINNLDYCIKLTDVPIELRTLDIIPKVLNNQYEVYTDGYRIGDDTGFFVYILKNGEAFNIFEFKLNKNHTVFHAELAAIDFAVC
ncbi:hypothetical protein AVEN_117373-1 [Araneus ventricosus]|uniref:Uncharacterized protein n=1 Tax=Araneus ventricosus TaxID=182803 RepID=A0A4Y2E3A4_ARAVE|nr:hypothetical protein AVEN_117373-1 [Araneus ventricosus]